MRARKTAGRRGDGGGSESTVMVATTSAQTLLSIIIVNWNTRDALSACLRSLIAHATTDPEIIVVDNASTDGSRDMLRVEFPHVQLMANPLNRGFARACNQGMRAARGTLLLLLNSDTYVEDDVIERAARYMLEHPHVSMAGCQLRFPDGRLQHTAARALGIGRSLFEDLWLYKFVPGQVRDRILLGGHWDGSAEREVDWLAGAFMMLRRAVFEESGGFDEDFFMYGEDSEWCLRLKAMGHRIFYVPLGVVYHIGSVSTDLRFSARGRLRLCHLGGFVAYQKLHGPLLGFLYKVARLIVSAVRWTAYSILLALGSNDYYAAQRRLYGWQVSFCLESLFTRYRVVPDQPACETAVTRTATHS
jgi:GT2 family glycosyltransferase